jgi:hypothetical protein
MTPVLLAAALLPADEFAAGVRLRADAAAARPHFAASAKLSDEAWANGDRSPAVARVRVAAHRLAGDLPRAVLAAREGLAVAPWDTGLQRLLELCRDGVTYPTPADPTERMRPAPPMGLRYCVGPADQLVASAVVALLLAVGLAARLTTRPPWDLPALAAGLFGLTALGVVGWRVGADEPTPAVVTTPTVLRTGNADPYPPRVAAPLPRGAEVTVLGRRGGWLQVQLFGGAVGWVPEAAVLTAGP